jgi:hypothetical protein
VHERVSHQVRRPRHRRAQAQPPRLRQRRALKLRARVAKPRARVAQSTTAPTWARTRAAVRAAARIQDRNRTQVRPFNERRCLLARPTVRPPERAAEPIQPRILLRYSCNAVDDARATAPERAIGLSGLDRAVIRGGLRTSAPSNFAHRGRLVGQIRQKPRILRHYRGGAAFDQFGLLKPFLALSPAFRVPLHTREVAGSKPAAPIDTFLL